MLEHSTPAEEGYGCESCWDTRILKHMLEEKFEITMSRSGIKDMLKRWGFSLLLARPIPSSVPVVRNKKRSNENGRWLKKHDKRISISVRR